LFRHPVLEHGSDQHRKMALEHLLTGLLEYSTNEQGSKSVVKALKEGGKETLDRVVQRMCEPAKGCVGFPFLFLPLFPLFIRLLSRDYFSLPSSLRIGLRALVLMMSASERGVRWSWTWRCR
jgi:hypothetical protein